MKTFDLEGSLRKKEDLGKKATKAIRANEMIPCVLYGGKDDNVNFQVKVADVRKLIYTPNIYLVNLTIDGKTRKAILKEIQFHPVKDNVLHIDFLEVFEDKDIVMEVPLKTEGLAEGVRMGGKLVQEMRKLRVKGNYKDIPEILTVNVENLALGKTIQVGALSFDKLQLLNASNNVVVSVRATRASRNS
ncbi:MAG: 50S ribosomal protein L25/general stress protein Ctc [Paludibacteraceae bacterium]|nr:50S ribosomal protein L25/general stress protein Ctc [Paludibacteraceae bacterium]